jgi:hypothetical protein
LAFRAQNPNATYSEVKAYAAAQYPHDKKLEGEFVWTWIEIGAENRKLGSDVDRIWPERKGY